MVQHFFTPLLWCLCPLSLAAQQIPLAEHPRPDFHRQLWSNLNGQWSFAFDSTNIGLQDHWHMGTHELDRKIVVPFPWGSSLSGVEDLADIGWYQREIKVDAGWQNKRTFLTIGASDWETTVWLDGHLLGKHRGGYVPFSFDLTDYLIYGTAQKLVIRVDDVRRDFTLYGKQGYGNARGIWQTIYLEARGQVHADVVHFTPNIDESHVTATVYLSERAEQKIPFTIELADQSTAPHEGIIRAGSDKGILKIPIEDQHLWTMDDPYLYEATLKIADDEVHSYFGMRKISVVDLPGTNHPYIAINDKPIYLQLALDQSYHPEGFYTFPSDQFMKEEIMRSKAIGLNGIRPHIKVEIPRKLYWADKLGLLVMADLPNSWGEPNPPMQREAERTLRQMIRRDYNHPSIFSWVVFNESWGLQTTVHQGPNKLRKYLPSTQFWVASMYYLAKSLDGTRLVEDNSICCGGGHTETDINSFHDYKPGWVWTEHLQDIVDRSHPGSPFHYEDGFMQGHVPLMNSECGNVWGYQGSTGDVDWSYDYHRMINSFRLFPEIAGWLYTEHHDVINEWNGYWRFDRSEKFTGLEEIMEKMTIRDLHSPVYISTGNEICTTVNASDIQEVSLYISSTTDLHPAQKMTLDYALEHLDQTGISSDVANGSLIIPYKPFVHRSINPLKIKMPASSGLALLKLSLMNDRGEVIHRNFKHFVVENGVLPKGKDVVTSRPDQFIKAQWSQKQWAVLDSLKMNGTGSGFFEYRIPIASELDLSGRRSHFAVEISAKELFVKDTEKGVETSINFMKGGKDAPSRNPNSYPMTDETTHPSNVTILVDGQQVEKLTLRDDPADHRGVLSWHSQLKDLRLREAGSYGYLIDIPIDDQTMRKAKQRGYLDIRLSSDGGGIAVYGKSFGRYPLDPSLIVE